MLRVRCLDYFDSSYMYGSVKCTCSDNLLYWHLCSAFKNNVTRFMYKCIIPDSNQFVGPLLGNGWSCWQHVIVGVLTLAQHCPTLKYQQLKYCWYPKRWLYNYMYEPKLVLSSGASDGPTHACRLY